MADRPLEKTEILAGGDPRLQPRLGRYRLERRLGAGGMAEVFLARAEGPSGFEKQVVVKRIRPQLAANKKFVEMFLREARLLARLDHPNIVRIIELDEERGEYFLALEYLEGLSLREVAERHWAVGRSLPLETLMQIIADVALGLDYAHNHRDQAGAAANLVHRDVSPDNIFVTTTGSVKVIDFGIAKLEGVDQLTQAGELKGKIPFMSPEQLQGASLDARCDLFSLGITTYWLLAGRRPFDGASDVHTMKSILEDPPPALRKFNTKLPLLIEDIVRSLLEKDRSKRMRSAMTLHDALSTLLVALPRRAPPPSLLVDAAQTLPAVDHEVVPVGLATVPVLPWPENAMAAVPRDDLAAAATRQQRSVAAVPLAPAARTAPEPVQKIPVWAPAHRERIIGAKVVATQLVPKDDLFTTAEHARVSSSPSSPSSPASADDSTGLQSVAVIAQTGPAQAVALSSSPQPPSGEFQARSDPVIYVERMHVPESVEPRREGSSSAPRRAQQFLDNSPTKAVAPVRLASEDLKPVETSPGDDLPPTAVNDDNVRELARSFAASTLPSPLAIDADGDFDIINTSRALPVAAGVFSALLVIGGALWITGALDQIRDLVRGRTRADAGISIGPVITVPDFSDASVVLLDAADAGSIVVAVLADAGSDDDALPDTDAPVDAGMDVAPDVAPDDPPDDPKGPPRPKRRAVSVLAPPSVQWQGASGEVYGAGRGTLRLPESVRAIYAVDLRRGSKTKINIERGTRVVDWNKLPRQKLSVRVRPYADVYLGKERVGTTPLAPFTVVTGKYEVKLVYKNITKMVPIEVKANAPATLNVVMTK